MRKTLLRCSGTFQNGQPNAHLPGLRHSAGSGKHRRFHGGTGENPVCNAPKVPHVTALFALCGLSEHLPEKLAQSQNQPHTGELCGAWLVAAIFRDAFSIVLYFTIEKQVYPVSDPPNIQRKYRLMFCTFSRLLYAERYGNIQLPKGVRVSGGHLCEAEAPTEAAAETVAAVWLTERLLQA